MNPKNVARGGPLLLATEVTGTYVRQVNNSDQHQGLRSPLPNPLAKLPVTYLPRLNSADSAFWVLTLPLLEVV
jgi:hypothetical protein